MCNSFVSQRNACKGCLMFRPQSWFMQLNDVIWPNPNHMQYKCTWLSFMLQLFINKAFCWPRNNHHGHWTWYIYDKCFNAAWHRCSWHIISWMYILKWEMLLAWHIISWMYILKWGMLLAATNSCMYCLIIYTSILCTHIHTFSCTHIHVNDNNKR